MLTWPARRRRGDPTVRARLRSAVSITIRVVERGHVAGVHPSQRVEQVRRQALGDDHVVGLGPRPGVVVCGAGSTISMPVSAARPQVGRRPATRSPRRRSPSQFQRRIPCRDISSRLARRRRTEAASSRDFEAGANLGHEPEGERSAARSAFCSAARASACSAARSSSRSRAAAGCSRAWASCRSRSAVRGSEPPECPSTSLRSRRAALPERNSARGLDTGHQLRRRPTTPGRRRRSRVRDRPSHTRAGGAVHGEHLAHAGAPHPHLPNRYQRS